VEIKLLVNNSFFSGLHSEGKKSKNSKVRATKMIKIFNLEVIDCG
jgi:hypothetical protein